MAKKVVRITESDLRRIINESVNRILSEADWKTYMSAADKDKDPKRAKRFRDYAVDKFNKEFGYDDGNGEVTRMFGDGHLEHYSTDVEDRQEFPNTFVTRRDGDKEHPTSHYQRRPGSNSQQMVKRPYTASKPHARAMQKAVDAHNAWKNDEFTYNKGLGYHNTNNKTDWHDYLDYNNK